MIIAKVVDDLPVAIRTDGAKLDLLEKTEWFRLPYPCQFHSPRNIDHQYYQILLAQRWRLGLCVLHTAHRGKKSFYQKVDNHLRNWFLSALMLC